MSNNRHSKISKKLSYWLRHCPEQIGIKISTEGWTDVRELLDKSSHIIMFDFNELKEIVENCKEQRFSLSEDFCSIRANQGHTNIKISFTEVIPPDILYHGTPVKSIDSIMESGLKKMQRHHVHLSVNKKTAERVGSRRGKFTILEIDAKQMVNDGIKIYISENGIYLTDEVSVKYIK